MSRSRRSSSNQGPKRGRSTKDLRAQGSDAAVHAADPAAPVRLNRFIARAGVASRRGADDLISRGLVKVNGQTVTELGTTVGPNDSVVVNGRALTKPSQIYILLNKPTDCITTTSDERGRRTVMDLIELSGTEGAGLFPVGRLDRATTGVLLLTNDGDLGHRLMHPRYNIDKDYKVVVSGRVTEECLERLRTGVALEDGPAKADQVHIMELLPASTSLGIRIHEGRNRMVRRMMSAVGHDVERLERVIYAGLTSKGVRRGKWRRLTNRETSRLRRLVGLKTNPTVQR